MAREQSSQATTGIVLIVIGLILTAGQLHLTWALGFGRLWPLILVAIGVGKLGKTPNDGRSREGLGWIMTGAILLLHTLRILELDDSWPLFIVAFGITQLVTRSQRSPETSGGSHGA